jgi:hypothetical protein
LVALWIRTGSESYTHLWRCEYARISRWFEYILSSLRTFLYFSASVSVSFSIPIIPLASSNQYSQVTALFSPSFVSPVLFLPVSTYNFQTKSYRRIPHFSTCHSLYRRLHPFFCRPGSSFLFLCVLHAPLPQNSLYSLSFILAHPCFEFASLSFTSLTGQGTLTFYIPWI